MKNSFLKGLIMTIVAFLASYIGDNIEAGVNWPYVIISTFGISIVYVGKNAWFQSDSPVGTINWKDILSGLILAIGTAITSYAASIITTGVIDWKALLAAVVSVIIGYFGKTFAINKGSISGK